MHMGKVCFLVAAGGKSSERAHLLSLAGVPGWLTAKTPFSSTGCICLNRCIGVAAGGKDAERAHLQVHGGHPGLVRLRRHL